MAQSLGLKIKDQGLKYGLGFMIQYLMFRIYGLEFMIQCLMFRVYGLVFDGFSVLWFRF